MSIDALATRAPPRKAYSTDSPQKKARLARHQKRPTDFFTRQKHGFTLGRLLFLFLSLQQTGREPLPGNDVHRQPACKGCQRGDFSERHTKSTRYPVCGGDAPPNTSLGHLGTHVGPGPVGTPKRQPAIHAEGRPSSILLPAAWYRPALNNPSGDFHSLKSPPLDIQGLAHM